MGSSLLIVMPLTLRPRIRLRKFFAAIQGGCKEKDKALRRSIKSLSGTRHGMLASTAGGSASEESGMKLDMLEQKVVSMVNPSFLENIGSTRALWYESPEDVEDGLAQGRERRRLLLRVRRAIRRCLTQREQKCLELHYFQAMTYRQIGELRGVNASSAQRAVRRGLRKLIAEFSAVPGKRPARKRIPRRRAPVSRGPKTRLGRADK